MPYSKPEPTPSEPQSSVGTTPASSDVLEELLARCIDAMEGEGDETLEQVLASAPEHAQELRELLESLEELDMVRESGPSRVVNASEIDGGAFDLLRKIGSGGMGVVYLARQKSPERLVAVKLLHAHLAQDARLLERFRREAIALARIEHPNVVRVLTCGEDDGRMYLVMDFVAGRSLAEILRSEEESTPSASRTEILDWGHQLAEALHAVHESGVVHRDVKPANVRITPDGRPILLDFGLAKQLAGSAFTQTGSFQGSPHYASPEQISGLDEVGPASDVYSLGVTLFEAFTRRVPFDGDTTAQVMHRILHAPWPRACKGEMRLPPSLDIVLQKACDRDPKRRYQTARAFGEDLHRVFSMRPIHAQRPTMLCRLRLWMRRNRAAALSLILACAALILLAGAYALRDYRAEVARMAHVETMLSEAESELSKLRADRESLLVEASSSRRERNAMMHAHHDAEVWKSAIARARRAEARVRERSIRHAAIEAGLDRVASLAPEADARIRSLRVSLYLERWELAKARGKREEQRFAAAMLRRIDPSPQMARVLDQIERVCFTSDRPGVRAWLFRYEFDSDLRDSGEPRLVPVPWRGVDKSAARVLMPGTTVLRVLRGAGELTTEDLIYEVSGHPVGGAVMVTRGNGVVQKGDRVVRVEGRRVQSWLDVMDFATAPGKREASKPRRFEVLSEGGKIHVLRTDSLLRELGIGAGASCRRGWWSPGQSLASRGESRDGRAARRERADDSGAAALL